MSDKIRDLYYLLKKYTQKMDSSGFSGKSLNLPDFDLYPDDYLSFAKDDLQEWDGQKEELQKTKALIRCVSNLKRALDAQIECFLEVYGLSEPIKRKHLSIRKKLEFIADIGIFSSKTIDRFLRIRNKVEHDFKKPIIKDIEALYDSVTANVSLLKVSMILRSSISTDWEIRDPEGAEIGSFAADYQEAPLSITFSSTLSPLAGKEVIQDLEEETHLSSHFDDRKPFAYYMRCILALQNLETFGSWDAFLKKITPIEEIKDNLND